MRSLTQVFEHHVLEPDGGAGTQIFNAAPATKALHILQLAFEPMLVEPAQLPVDRHFQLVPGLGIHHSQRAREARDW